MLSRLDKPGGKEEQRELEVGRVPLVAARCFPAGTSRTSPAEKKRIIFARFRWDLAESKGFCADPAWSVADHPLPSGIFPIAGRAGRSRSRTSWELPWI